MYTQCPHCANPLRASHPSAGTLFLCPYCQRVFRLDACVAARQLFAALDVSTSAERQFARMLEVLTTLLNASPGGPFSDISILLFHRRVVPFPCEQLGGLQPANSVIIPTLRDLHNRVGRGTAVLDVLHRMLEDAERQPIAARELVILTDGEDRCSRRHPEELRYKIERATRDTVVHLHIFADGVTSGPQRNLVRKLSVPSILWSVHPDQTSTHTPGVAISQLYGDQQQTVRIRSN
jgi:hypothetical protein